MAMTNLEIPEQKLEDSWGTQWENPRRWENGSFNGKKCRILTNSSEVFPAMFDDIGYCILLKYGLHSYGARVYS
jgi:hypothetical protein